MTCVNWEDAQDYVSWLSRTTGAQYRLPTEEEWERGAAGSHPGCGERDYDTGGTCPVGAYGANEVGLYDVLGNVSELTESCLDEVCRRRALRGSSWSERAGFYRMGTPVVGTDARYHQTGFRVGRTLRAP